MKFTPQRDQMDCGPACLSMVASYYGKDYPLDYLRSSSFITRDGVSLLGISEAAEKIGFQSFSAKVSINELKNQIDALPCILHWNQNHFVILAKISQNPFSKKYCYHIADPGHGKIKLAETNFKKSWISKDNKGIALFLNPTESFYQKEPPKKEKESISYLFNYLKAYRKQLILMFLLLLAGSVLTLIFPFLTQALIDNGIKNKDMNIIFMILLAQLGVFVGSITIEVFRNWLMLYVGTHLSIEIIANFFKKMLQLPIKFFDTKTMGDFNQRIQDNNRIEEFLTSQSMTTFFSIITFSVFFAVLWYYDFKILLVYLLLYPPHQPHIVNLTFGF